MDNNQKRLSLSALSLILSLIPLGVDVLFLTIAWLNAGNWAYFILGLYILPATHFLLGLGGLAVSIAALSKQQRRVKTYISLALCGIYVILGGILLRFLIFRFV